MVWADSSNYAHNYSSAVPAFLWFHTVTHLKQYENTTHKTGSEYFPRKNRESYFPKLWLCLKSQGIPQISKLFVLLQSNFIVFPQVLKNTVTCMMCRLCWGLSPCSLSVWSGLTGPSNSFFCSSCSLGAAPGQPCSRWGLTGAQGRTGRSSRDLFPEPGTG